MAQSPLALGFLSSSYVSDDWARWLMVALCLLVVVSDFGDGYLARRFGVPTPLAGNDRQPLLDSTDAGCIATAARAINAIDWVCSAPAGLISVEEIPLSATMRGLMWSASIPG